MCRYLLIEQGTTMLPKTLKSLRSFTSSPSSRAAKAVKPNPKLKHMTSYHHETSDTPLTFKTFYQEFREWTEARPDKEMIIFREQNIIKTYEEVYCDARKLVLGLIHLNVKRGDRIGIWGPNYYEWVVAQYAAGMGGMVLVNLNPAYQTEEFRLAMKKVGIKVLITPPKFRYTNYYSIICGLTKQMKTAPIGMGMVQSQILPDLKHYIMFNLEHPDHEGFPGAWNLRDIMASGGTDAVKYLNCCERRTCPDDPMNIQYTSGTTGIQKAATLTHFGILNVAKLVGRGMGMDENVRLCIPNPLFHCFGSVIGTITVPQMGGTMVFPSSWFNAELTASTIHEYGCTALYGTPTMFVGVLEAAKNKGFRLDKCKKGIIGGSPCPQPLCQELVEAGMTELTTSYGTTEMSSCITLTDYKMDPFERIKNVGRVLPHNELAIMDSRGRSVPRGTAGEIWVRGPGTMRYYYDEPGETAKAISADRWYHTGDMGYMNEDGTIAISGRLRDMIIRGGENIYPAEIEQFLYRHPSISNAYVVGIPDHKYGEKVCAVIILKPNAPKLTAEEVKKFCRHKISHYKIPEFILFKDEECIPMTTSGKVKKFVLSQKCQKALGRKPRSKF
ncbi:unnamed protein product [Bursaphelenchus okinawaensis]|uniref:Uncharacterized protein n=1 Tax=Bursaphelenchus okinawaensis TaxID=465554 RepID=A0A811LSN0_9BILA|nr:unnamed protein product [Bursaphelenchus okinawaensis]CAG9127872.1 unnamed protein product [Bursaphelenchus okinawaensis]